MDWFLYDRDLRNERVKRELFSIKAQKKLNFENSVAKYKQKKFLQSH